jgi:hypothetical protein
MDTPTCKDKLSDINFKYSNWKTDQQNVRLFIFVMLMWFLKAKRTNECVAIYTITLQICLEWDEHLTFCWSVRPTTETFFKNSRGGFNCWSWQQISWARMLSVKRRRKSRIQRTQVRKHKSYHSEYFTIS